MSEGTPRGAPAAALVLSAHPKLGPCRAAPGLGGTGLATPRARGWGPGRSSPPVRAIPCAEQTTGGPQAGASAGAGRSCPLISPLPGPPAPCGQPSPALLARCH